MDRRIIIIRHGATAGNFQKRYVGCTDEPLLEESVRALKEHTDESIKKVYISPMRRALQTAEILFPNAEYIVIDELRECDFGEYEYMNHAELDGLIPYQRFIDSMGFIPFPGGEGREEQIIRTMKGFERIMEAEKGADGDIHIVAHAGTMMALMDWIIVPHRDFYEWMRGNGEGYVIRCEDEDRYTVCGVYP